MLGSALVNLAGLLLGQAPGYWTYDPPLRPLCDCIFETPAVQAVYLVAAQLRPDDWPDRSWGSPSHESGCPHGTAVDLQAEPAFPLVGPGRPFRGAAPTVETPIFCVLIGADGRVRRIRTVQGAPAAAILVELRRLPFVPARRDGAPTAAWHWLIVNLPYAPPERRTPPPDRSYVPLLL